MPLQNAGLEGKWDTELQEIVSWMLCLAPTDSLEAEFQGLHLAMRKAVDLGIAALRT